MIRADVLALLGAVALTATALLGPLGERSPRVPVTDEIAGSNPAGVATTDVCPPGGCVYVRPAHKDLLRGKACIPITELLANRAIPAIHSYSRSVACE